MNGFVLKLIALASMIVDHTGAALFPGAQWMRMIGRIAFPIYIFLIAQGCRHTSSMGKYALRLFVFALISELPYDIALFARPGEWFTLGHQNIFFTLCLGVLAVWGFQQAQKKKIPFAVALLCVLPCCLAAHFLHTDYGWVGVLAIFLCALMPNKWAGAAAVSAFVLWQYRLMPIYLACAMLAIPLLLLYNGKRGPKARLSFYAAYPVHLAVLACIKLFPL